MIQIPNNFKEEFRILNLNGYNTWASLRNLNDATIYKLIHGSKCSLRNMMKIRCISCFIDDLGIHFSEASLLMHSGISSVKSLAQYSPEELLKKTSRLERNLKRNAPRTIDLIKASRIIKEAKEKYHISKK